MLIKIPVTKSWRIVRKEKISPKLKKIPALRPFESPFFGRTCQVIHYKCEHQNY